MNRYCCCGKLVATLVGAVLTLDGAVALGYPTDDYERTGIRRLKWQYDVDFNGLRGSKMPRGGRWPSKMVELRMLEEGNDYELTAETPKDPQLQKELKRLLRRWGWRRYNVAVLDITEPGSPRFAGVSERVSQTPGSVAKLLVGAGMFQQLRERFPNDIAARERLLRTHEVTADDWSKRDSHTVPVFSSTDPSRVSHRRIRTGDTFTLWEWMDHALSASNNSAASTMWREATLMKLLGENYPPPAYNKELWATWDRSTFTQASFDIVNEPLINAGIDPEELRLRLYFTKGANRYINEQSCGSTPLSLLQWLVRVEQGKMVDEFSSLELKKMMYLTRRRVRYFYTRKLNDFGAFFKSGSLYRFSPEAKRVQYEGDLLNVLNALVEVDTTYLPDPVPLPYGPDSGVGNEPPRLIALPSDPAEQAAAGPARPARPLVYMVAVMSNQLKRNAALDHAKLGEELHGVIASYHEKKAAEAAAKAAETAGAAPDGGGGETANAR